MACQKVSLADLPCGVNAKICDFTVKNAFLGRILELGLVAGTIVNVERIAPLGCPIAISCHGNVVCLRKDVAKNILVCVL